MKHPIRGIELQQEFCDASRRSKWNDTRSIEPEVVTPFILTRIEEELVFSCRWIERAIICTLS
jgi:hypothetical protein